MRLIYVRYLFIGLLLKDINPRDKIAIRFNFTLN